MTIERLYEDENIILVNKPAGLLVIPDRFDHDLPSIRTRLQAETDGEIFIVHRLDRDTSGTLVVAKNAAAHKFFSQQFEAHEVGKFYAGLVHGHPVPDSGRIEAAIMEHPVVKGKMAISKKGKASITDYKVAEQWAMHALVQLQIHTGRTHQIRVHMASLGHAIVADPLYGDGEPFLLSSVKRKYNAGKADEEERPLLNRLALHAYKLVLTNMDGNELVAEASLPKDMAATVKQLNKWSRR